MERRAITEREIYSVIEEVVNENLYIKNVDVDGPEMVFELDHIDSHRFIDEAIQSGYELALDNHEEKNATLYRKLGDISYHLKQIADNTKYLR